MGHLRGGSWREIILAVDVPSKDVRSILMALLDDISYMILDSRSDADLCCCKSIYYRTVNCITFYIFWPTRQCCGIH